MESLRPRGLVEYLEILWRKKLLIFFVAASMLIATFVVIRRVPNIYEARSLIVITKPALEDQIPTGSPLAAWTQQMTSRGNLAAIVRRYGLYHHARRPITDPDAAVERMRKDIKLDVKMRNYYPDAPESMLISFRYTDPIIAQRVVADLVSTFEQANVMIRQQAATEMERFHGKISDIETRLRTLGPQRDSALFRAGYSGGSPSEVRAQRLTATGMIDSLSDKEVMLQRQIEDQQRQIAEQQKLAKAAARANGAAGSGAYGVLLARRAEVEGQIKDLTSVATEKNPKMIQARTQLTQINREISRLESDSEMSAAATAGLLSPEGRELRSMQREEQRLQTELEATRRDLSRKRQGLSALRGAESLPALSGGRAAESKADYDRVLGRYNWMMDKQETLQKLSGGDGQNVSMFQVIDAPYVAPSPVAPNRLLLILLGLAFAVGLGLLVAGVREFPQLFLVHNDRDVDYYLGTTVLAQIPEISTPYERSSRRRWSGLRWVGLTLLAAMLIPVFVTAVDSVQIFQILASR